MDLKDAMRERCIGEVAEAWYQLASTYSSKEPDIAVMVLKTVNRYISWIDISLVANDRSARNAQEVVVLCSVGLCFWYCIQGP